MHKLFLTFDTEDFISKNSVPALNKTVELLNKYELKGLFFITGHMAEKLCSFPETIDLLSMHQIGFHTSSHSVHPTVFEFTDVESYEEAYRTSLQRETAHINPLSGAVEGKGGIYALRALFPQKQINSFRAPGFCWTPPHLDALKTLGISYDFSAALSVDICSYNGINFYPRPTPYIYHARTNYKFVLDLLIHNVSVFMLHPSDMVNQQGWDLIYHKSNPITLIEPTLQSPKEISILFHEFEMFLRRLSSLKKLGVLEVTPPLKSSKRTINPTLPQVERCYAYSMDWAVSWFKYQPQFLHNHFEKFFRINSATR